MKGNAYLNLGTSEERGELLAKTGDSWRSSGQENEVK